MEKARVASVPQQAAAQNTDYVISLENTSPSALLSLLTSPLAMQYSLYKYIKLKDTITT